MENATSSRKDVKVNAYRGEYNCTYSGLCNYAMTLLPWICCGDTKMLGRWTT